MEQQKLNVLSLFDGMSCGQLALKKQGLEVNKYFASEIDKHAIKITQKNFPNTIQLGDVTKVNGSELPKIDLLIGGSPCQGFSFAGKQLNFNDPRSKLFFEYVRLLNECRPKYFLLENVKMKKESQDIITKYLGVEPIEINSALVSAQSRIRLYWTNILGVRQPRDKHILLKDVLSNIDCFDGTYNQHKTKPSTRSLGCVEVGHANLNGHDFLKRIYSPDGKCPTLTAICGGNQERKVSLNKSQWRKLTPIECERLQTVPDNYTDGVSNTQRYKMLGNGWTIDVIAHIFSYINQQKETKPIQMLLDL